MASHRYRDQAEQGDPTARVNLGYMYHQGRGTKQDDDKAVQWYTNPTAIYNCDLMSLSLWS